MQKLKCFSNSNVIAINQQIKEPLPFTTVVQKLNRCSSQSRLRRDWCPFVGSFLASKKEPTIFEKLKLRGVGAARPHYNGMKRGSK